MDNKPTSTGDAVLVSPSAVELPSTIVISSSDPHAQVELCNQGSPDPRLPGVAPEHCSPYLVGRSGPDASGRYLSEWRLAMAPVGGLVIFSMTTNSLPVHIAFTVTGNRLGQFGDFRSCVDQRTGKGYVFYYSQVPTAITAWLRQKVRKGDRWVWEDRKPKQQEFPISRSEYGDGYTPFSHRMFRMKLPEAGPPTRAIYVVKQGRKTIKKGAFSKRPCTNDPGGPFVSP